MINLRHAVNHARHGDWDKAHQMVHADDSLLGSWLHGIVHLQKGELENAGTLYARARRNFDQRGTAEQELGKLESELQD
jgi:hypothetical protein